MTTCEVFGCQNRQNPQQTSIRFFSFPKEEHEEELFFKWKIACGGILRDRKKRIVCSDHFSADCYKECFVAGIPFSKWHLKSTAVPNENLPVEVQCHPLDVVEITQDTQTQTE